MNAYELADWLDRRRDAYEPNGWSADMLRQQADRIAELDKSAEPVAWTNQKWLDGIAREPQLFQPLFVHGKQTEHNTIPLYTTPQIKELSDEEISLVIWESYQSIGNATLTDLCKAILKKASEK